jgi:hypothetical protein
MQEVFWQGIEIAFSELQDKTANFDKMTVYKIKSARPIGVQQICKTLKNISQ